MRRVSVRRGITLMSKIINNPRTVRLVVILVVLIIAAVTLSFYARRKGSADVNNLQISGMTYDAAVKVKLTSSVICVALPADLVSYVQKINSDRSALDSTKEK